MHINTLRFGQIDVPDEAIIHFPNGIVGFPQLQRGCLLPCDHPSGDQPSPGRRPSPRLRWLQSVDDPALLFLTVEPHLIFPDYEIELSDADSAALQLDSPADAAVITLITLSDKGAALTANLLAPIIINAHSRRARQVILDADRYLTKHLIASRTEGDLNAGADTQAR
jgi:flagellar assembly factor FliW